MNARADIDLVLPCYNPPSGWEERVATHFREVERLFSPVRFHLFIVSDGSRRGYEPETIDRLRQLIPDVCVVDYKPNRGKGYALREAVKRCTSPYIIYTDYDFPYTNDSFGRMVEALLGGADVVVATRGKSYQDNLPPFRQMLSKLPCRYACRHTASANPYGVPASRPPKAGLRRELREILNS